MDWEQIPTLLGDRICLRAVSSNDVDALYTIFSDPKVMRYWSTPPLADRADAVALVDEIRDGFQQRSTIKWGIAQVSDDDLIGTTTLFNLNLENGRAEIGYALGRAHWGHGFMHEALTTLIRYCFETLNLRRLEADIDPRNSSSIRTVERLGFEREGLMRERWQVNGETQDTIFFGLLQRDWKELQKQKLKQSPNAQAGS
jgi:[ribosomal protein S5]-alanine N-acetyltransferase